MKVDMSPEAVKNRLKMVSQLRRLSLALGNAKKETDAKRERSKVKKKRKIETNGADIYN